MGAVYAPHRPSTLDESGELPNLTDMQYSSPNTIDEPVALLSGATGVAMCWRTARTLSCR